MNKKLIKGFTLIELLVVIAIIAVLAMLLLLQTNVARSKSRDAKRIGDVNQLRTATEEYYDDNLNYPTTLTIGNLGKYLNNSVKLPKDPSTQADYGYGSTGVKYQIWAQLENINLNAFNNDADINASTWLPTAGVDGSSEAGGGDTKCDAPGVGAKDCVLDLGVQ